LRKPEQLLAFCTPSMNSSSHDALHAATMSPMVTPESDIGISLSLQNRRHEAAERLLEELRELDRRRILEVGPYDLYRDRQAGVAGRARRRTASIQQGDLGTLGLWVEI
jgi:hypothetical protein